MDRRKFDEADDEIVGLVHIGGDTDVDDEIEQMYRDEGGEG